MTPRTMKDIKWRNQNRPWPGWVWLVLVFLSFTAGGSVAS